MSCSPERCPVCGRKVENAEGLGLSFGFQGAQTIKDRIDWKAGFDDLLPGKPLLDQSSFRLAIRDEPEVAGRLPPGRIDFN